MYACVSACVCQGYRSTDHVPLHFNTTTARDTGPRKKGVLVIGEVLGVTAAGIAMVRRQTSVVMETSVLPFVCVCALPPARVYLPDSPLLFSPLCV